MTEADLAMRLERLKHEYRLRSAVLRVNVPLRIQNAVCLAGALILMVLIMACGNASRRHPVIVLNDWHNLDYAESACKSRAGLGYDPWCIDPKMSALDYESQLEGIFAAEPACRGVSLVHWEGPRNSKEGEIALARKSPSDWNLMLDMDSDPRDRPVSWSLINLGKDTPKIFASMEARTPSELVLDACHIARHAGGDVH